MSGRVLFYVQHLLGIGHVKRAATLARALKLRGMKVTVVSGGMPVEVLDTAGFDLVQLPPIRAADRTFQGLVDAEDAPVEAALIAQRRDILLATLARTCPDVAIVEQFPFGRRQLSGEIVPLIEAARARKPRPSIVCSVRDILVEKNRPDREADMVALARRHFDAILVHGDPSFIPFDKTFPRAREIADLIHYTGYVVEPGLMLRQTPRFNRGDEGLTLSLSKGEAHGSQGAGEVIVSAGSGATGEALLRTAMAARADTALAGATWRMLAGPSLPEDVFVTLMSVAPEGVVVERVRPDFVTLLRNCALSISQGGYNTVMETLASRVRAVVVPYAGGHETEQTLRARLLAERGLVQQVPETELSVPALVRAVRRALLAPHRPLSLDLGGAAKTAEFVDFHRVRAAV